MLDLTAMSGVRVDPEKRTGRAQGGVNWGTFDRETQQFGLAVTGGRVTTTGVAGFTTGSGSGWLERKYGFACDNLISADVVTADGEVVVANESENSDLFWGLRGGGGNFGVITELEFNLHPAGPIVYAGLTAFDPAKGREVINTWRDLSDGAAGELGWAVASVVAPPEPFVPEQWHGKRMWAIAGQFAGSQDDAEKILAPMRALGPEFDLFQPMPYTMIQGLLDGANPYGRRNYWRAHNLADFDDKLTDALLERAESMPSPFSAMIVLNMAGAIADVDDDATALGGRAAPFSVHLNTMWEGAENDDANIAWTRGATTAFKPWISSGMALNFYTEVGDDEIVDSFGGRLGAAEDAEAEVRPGQPVPAEPEHQALSGSEGAARSPSSVLPADGFEPFADLGDVVAEVVDARAARRATRGRRRARRAASCGSGLHRTRSRGRLRRRGRARRARRSRRRR